MVSKRVVTLKVNAFACFSARAYGGCSLMQTKREAQLFLCRAHTRIFAYNAHGVLVFYRGEVVTAALCAASVT